MEVRERRDVETKKDWQGILAEEGFDNDSQFDATIKKLEGYMKKAKKKDTEGDEMEVRIDDAIVASFLI